MTLDSMQTLRAAIMEARDQIRKKMDDCGSTQEQTEFMYLMSMLMSDAAMGKVRVENKAREEWNEQGCTHGDTEHLICNDCGHAFENADELKTARKANSFYAGKAFEREQQREGLGS